MFSSKRTILVSVLPSPSFPTKDPREVVPSSRKSKLKKHKDKHSLGTPYQHSRTKEAPSDPPNNNTYPQKTDRTGPPYLRLQGFFNRSFFFSKSLEMFSFFFYIVNNANPAITDSISWLERKLTVCVFLCLTQCVDV